jgi:hypothetical protein
MLGIAILFSFSCSLRSPLAAPYSLLHVGNDRVTGGSKVLEFYEAFAKQRATLLKADGKDILSVKMHLNSERQAEKDAETVAAEIEGEDLSL